MEICEKDKKTEEMCGLKEFHKDCLETLKYIDKLAEENNIIYSSTGGTMLGQIRHKGFIPWDDDVDLNFTRENFDKLINVLSKNPNSQFKLLTPRSYNGEFVDLVYRLVNTKSSYTNGVFSRYKDLKHTWVDLFVLDNVPSNKFKFKIHAFRIKILYALLSSRKKIKISLKLNPIIKVGMFGFKILGRLFPLSFLLNRIDKLSVKYSYKDKYKSHLHCSNSMIDVDDLLDYNDVKDSIKLPFSNTNIQCYIGYKKMLTIAYGDYMTPKLDSCKFIRHFNLSKYSDEEIFNFYKNN